MTVAAIMEQAQALSPQERKELAKLLIDSLDIPAHGDSQTEAITTIKTGAEIAAMLAEMEPIDFVDLEIADPVEWVKAQRRKETDRLKPFWENEQ